MSSLSGGPAEKAGAIYETLWGVHAMLDLLHETAERIRVEEPRVDGAEFATLTDQICVGCMELPMKLLSIPIRFLGFFRFRERA